MKKRGQGAQFNWIFVVVAGGIILAFLVAFTFRYIDLQNKKANVKVARNIDNNFRLLQTTEFSLPIDLGTTNKVEFYCEVDKEFLVVNEDYDQVIKNVVVFAPKVTRGKQLVAWVYNWEYPFLVSRFLYVSGLDNKYVFIYDNYPGVLDEVPSLFNIEKAGSLSESGAEDSVKTKFIYFSEPSADLNKIKKNYPSSKVVFIDQDNNKVVFYEGESRERRDAEYYGDAFLFGAMFADSFDSYNCAYNRALEKLKAVSKTYIYKTSYVSNLDRRAECNYHMLKNNLEMFANGDVKDKYADALDEINKNLYGNGCPAVF